MVEVFDSRAAFEAEVEGRFGLLPNFFRSSLAAPELIEELWGFAKAAYLDSPIPSLFKERLFVWLSRFCRARYCIVRHVGFLLGLGRSSGDAYARAQTRDEVIALLKRPTPWARDMPAVYARLEELPQSQDNWPNSGTEVEDLMFACAALVFTEPAFSEPARGALLRVVGARALELLFGYLAFIRVAHYWTMLHPEIETEEDVNALLRQHEELARLLLEDPEANRCELGSRLFDELIALRELHEREELKKAKAALEEKDRQKDQFIAVLAHELRNPLAAIRVATDTLGLLNLTDKKIGVIRERLDRQAAAMTRMLDDLFDASRITLGKVSVQLEQIDFRDFVHKIASAHEEDIRKAGLEFEYIIAPGDYHIRGDRIRLQQVIENLLTNAVRFTPPPGRIAVHLRSEPDHAILTVQDTGIGFDAKLAAKLFAPFTQQEQGLGHPGGGLGLGLAISSRLAELQSGSLSGESPRPGRGAVFMLRLPLSDESSMAAAVAVDRHESKKDASVLLVEDNRDVADSLVELLELAGFDVEVAYDGESAMEHAIASPPASIICDVGLPGGMDGYQVARACRAEASLREARLIAISGYSGPEYTARAKAAGFDLLMAKPLTIEALEAALRKPRIR